MPSNLVNAFKDIRTLIINAVASEGNVGQKVLIEGGVKDDPGFPYIVVENEANDDSEYRTHDSSQNAEDLEFSVHIHTKGRLQGLTLRDLVITSLNGYSGVTGNTTFGHLHRTGGAHFYNEKLKSNEEIIDFTSLITNN
jgi:hypothetical protein